ncbi:MAG: C40 family peptidase [Candidatus Nanopelagicus sp.]|jgi:cell wall-associated NlpC family hydrolase|nr:C40 family peptidase [Candidatus Nanopelagicus sp.]
MLKKIIAAILITTLTPTVAIAATPKPTQAQIDAAKKLEAEKKAVADAAAAKLNNAKKTLKQLSVIAATKRKAYLAAQNELKLKTKKADLAMKHLQIAQTSVSNGKIAIGKLAVNAYVMGGGFTNLDSLLKADGPQDLADRLTTLDVLGENNSTALERFKSAEKIASSAQVVADTAKKAQSVATVKVASAKKEADTAQSMQKAEVDKLQVVQDKLAKELAVAQKTRVTLEQQRQLALLEEANAERAAVTVDQSKIWPDIGFTGRSSTRATEAMRIEAVAYSAKQVNAGKKYVWGSEGPNTFDCSGLIYAAYKSAGLGWPNWDRLNSSLYWVATKRVPLSELVPGDLLFYSYKGTVSTIHHMSIYAGDGMMWEAHNKDKDLLFSSIYSVKGLMPYGGRV